MLRRLQIAFILVAWLLATGSQWDLVQTLAWGRMTVDNAQSMPLGEAITRTFAPDNMCGVCRAVAAARQEQSPHAGVPGGNVEGKILIVVRPVPVVFAPVVVCSTWLDNVGWAPNAARAAPPLPPPRAA